MLTHSPHSEVSQAYLTLAAEWLNLANQAREEPRLWSFKTRQASMAKHRQEMQQRIEAWLMDPSSLLFSDREAARHTDPQVLEELFRITRQTGRPRFPIWRLAWIGLLAVTVPLALAAVVSLQDRFDHWRLEIGAWFIGPGQYWQAGSTLLVRSNEAAYRELLLAAKLVDANRAPLQTCAGQARESGAAVSCAIHVEPWR